MSISTDGFGTILAGLEAGGGGSIIPDEGEITGTYEGNLVCLGDVTVTGDLEVKGSMLVLGDFINEGGHEVTIRGDLHAQSILFDKAVTATPQQNFRVDGDLIFTYMEFRQCGELAAHLRVGGDLIGSTGGGGSILQGEGIDGDAVLAGTPGLDIIVYGKLQVASVYVYGGENILGSAGSGGFITVYGDCNAVLALDLSGGNATNGAAGNGGHLSAYADVVIPDGTLSVRGGNGNNGTAANGGNVYVEGNFSGEELSAYGGDCDSDSELHRSGTGGNITVSGQVTYCGFMTVSGGDRFGTLAAGNTLDAPNAGEINVNGGISADDVNAVGGSVFTANFAPHNAGNGGDLEVVGFLLVSHDLQLEGGEATQGNGGNGGEVDVEGHASIGDDFYMNGGDANNGNGGNGGQADFRAGLDIDEVRMEGGDGTNGNGGDGASLFVKGNLTVNEFYNGYGGSCDSTDETHYAGSGGSITVEGNFHYEGDDDDLDLTGGDRFGATTVANVGGTPANGGSLSVSGNFTSKEPVLLSAGGVFTDYPYGPGGNAGNLYVDGSCYVDDDIYMNGGRAVGSTAGNGGQVQIGGHAGFILLECDGGQAAQSVLLGDAGTAGTAGTVTFRAGVSTGEISQLDGPFEAGGSAPAGDVNLYLAGNCTIGTIDMTARADTYIRQYVFFDNPVVLKVTSLPAKSTLNDALGAATGPVTASLNGLFITGTGGTWYAIAGTIVV